MDNILVKESENKVAISIDAKLYPLKAVYGAAYVFLDKSYIFLEGDPEKKIKVSLKGKDKMSKEDLQELADEFLNELLNYSLRYEISKQNQKIREYIVGAALIGSSKDLEDDSLEAEGEEWQEDPMGIAVPWEEKYGKKKE